MSNQAEKLIRNSSPELDAILGQTFPILDDGFVRVVDYMGTDESVVQAARVSYGKGTKKRHEDRGLIRYLIRHHHTTPFEMCEIKLHVRVPMDTWRQWIRHRTANVNEYSTRYSVAVDAMYTTAPDQWRMQATTNRQGSEGFADADLGQKLSAQEKELHNLSRKIYDERLEQGVAREQARKDLPLCTYTEAYWKIDLHNLLNFLRLRMEGHAQYEIRQYAKTIGEEIVSRWVPFTWEAFQDYMFTSATFSNAEGKILAALTSGNKEQAIALAEEYGWLKYKDGKLAFQIERFELEQKLRQFNIAIPWA